MTPCALPLLALLAGPSQAGELLIEAPITLVVKVNGMTMDFEAGTSLVVVRNLKTDEYQVEIQNAFGKTKAQELVRVDEGEAVRLAYSKKALVELGRGPMQPGGTPPQGLEPELHEAAEAVERIAEDVAEELRTATQEVIEAVDPPEEATPAENPPAETPPTP